MKRITTTIIFTLSVLLCLGAVSAHAGYKDALILVRKGKWAKAVSEFEKLVAENHAPSQFSLGLIYHLGRGVPPDFERAYNLYKMSTLQDHPPAVNNLGMMYLNGDYVEKNQSIAFKLFEKAGAAHAQAKDNLGQCFENGWGVEADYEQAINFYQLAGDEGYKLAYYHWQSCMKKAAAVPRSTSKKPSIGIKLPAKKNMRAAFFALAKFTNRASASPKISTKPFFGISRPPIWITPKPHEK